MNANENFDWTIRAGEQYRVELPNGQPSDWMTMAEDKDARVICLTGLAAIFELEDGTVVYLNPREA